MCASKNLLTSDVTTTRKKIVFQITVQIFVHGQTTDKSRMESIGKWKNKGKRRMNERRKNVSRRTY
jgi:hypothetical protein